VLVAGGERAERMAVDNDLDRRKARHPADAHEDDIAASRAGGLERDPSAGSRSGRPGAVHGLGNAYGDGPGGGEEWKREEASAAGCRRHSGRCWRRNCSISATSSDAGGRSLSARSAGADSASSSFAAFSSLAT
jgi:hypothetical protein